MTGAAKNAIKKVEGSKNGEELDRAGRGRGVEGSPKEPTKKYAVPKGN